MGSDPDSSPERADAPEPIPPRPDFEGGEPPRRRALATRLIAAVTALLVGGVAVAAYVGRPEREPAPVTPTDGKLVVGRDYAFLATASDGGPVRWNPCEPIHYVVNADEAPDGALDVVKEAARRVGEAAGVRFVFDGLTHEIPTEGRRPAMMGEYGTGWDPVVIAWARPGETDIPLGERDADINAVARAIPLPSTVDTDDVYVGGVIVLDATVTTAMAFDSSASWGVILMHELGHVLGLDHVTSLGEVMNEGYSFNTDWGRGDRFALAQVGRKAGCLKTPPPPRMCYVEAPPGSVGSIAAADAVASDDVWAVGDGVFHWDGESWEENPFPPGEARGVADVSAQTVLVVGRSDRDGGFPLAAILEDSTWLPDDLGLDPKGHGELNAISASGPGEIWTVGAWAPSRNAASGPLALHWDGQSWVDTPLPGPEGGSLVDVWAGEGEAWALGAAPSGSFLLRWDGESWNQLDVPLGDVEVRAVAAGGPDDVWLAGGRGYSGLVFHWDGRSWEQSQPIRDADGFEDVVVDAAGDVWLAGRRSGPQGLAGPLVALFDGRRWVELPGESPWPGVRAVAEAVAPLGPGGAFAFGSAGMPESPLILGSC